MSTKDVATLTKEFSSRIEWWRVLRILQAEYNNLLDQIQGQFDMDNFDKYVENNYGVKILYDKQGNILGSYDIVNKHKHLILLLRFGK